MAFCAALYIDDEFLAFHFSGEDAADAENEKGLFLSFEHDLGLEKFNEKDNQIIKIGPDGHMILTNTSGELTKIMPLVCKPVK